MTPSTQQGLSEERLREIEARLEDGWKDPQAHVEDVEALIAEVRRVKHAIRNAETDRKLATDLLGRETKHPLGDDYRPSPSWLATGAEGYDHD